VLPFQISSKLVKCLYRYGDLTVFKLVDLLYTSSLDMHKEYLVVYTVIQYLIGIDAVVLIV